MDRNRPAQTTSRARPVPWTVPAASGGDRPTHLGRGALPVGRRAIGAGPSFHPKPRSGGGGGAPRPGTLKPTVMSIGPPISTLAAIVPAGDVGRVRGLGARRIEEPGGLSLGGSRWFGSSRRGASALGGVGRLSCPPEWFIFRGEWRFAARRRGAVRGRRLGACACAGGSVLCAAWRLGAVRRVVRSVLCGAGARVLWVAGGLGRLGARRLMGVAAGFAAATTARRDRRGWSGPAAALGPSRRYPGFTVSAEKPRPAATAAAPTTRFIDIAASNLGSASTMSGWPALRAGHVDLKCLCHLLRRLRVAHVGARCGALDRIRLAA